jgi:hypothetical protein
MVSIIEICLFGPPFATILSAVAADEVAVGARPDR